ncbi:MAG: hypothetical protein AAF996_17040 [Pseudomonadota bacterium]
MSETTLKGRMEHCWETQWSKTFEPDSKRFKDKDGALAARRNLLLLFQEATTGWDEHFFVLRREWPRHQLKREVQTSIAYPDEFTQKIDKSYRPFVSQMLDDIAIMAFFEDDTSIFNVYCKSQTLKKKGSTKADIDTYAKSKVSKTPIPYDAFTDFVVHDYDVVWGPSRWIGKDRPYAEACEFEHKGGNAPGIVAEKKIKQDCAKLSNIYSKLDPTTLKKDPVWKTRKWAHRVKVVSAPDQFALGSSASGATIGSVVLRNSTDTDVINPEDAQWTANAAIGWSHAKTHTRKSLVKMGSTSSALPRKNVSERVKTSTRTITPYIAIDLDPTDLKSREPNSDGIPTIITKKVEYAILTAGLRLDWQEGITTSPMDASQVVNARDFALTGRSIPGNRWALSAELITDNFNLQSAERVGGEWAPPGSFLEGLGPLYETYGPTPFPLDAFGQKRLSDPTHKSRWTWWNNAWSGIYINWDAKLVTDYLNYSRAPRDFEPESDDVGSFVPLIVLEEDDRFLEGLLYGTDLSLTLSKHDFLSIGKDDVFATLNLKRVSRNEWNGDQEATRWEAEFKLIDPENSKNRFISLKYEDGESFRSGQGVEDQVTFNLGYRF